jgi:AcrR family transcriptional regulator
MARPITINEDDLLAAAEWVLLRHGPSAFTLARAADRAGVSAATFIKRFGSKERLFLRLSQRWVASLDGALRRAADRHDTSLGRLRAVALHNYYDLDNPATASNQLAALAIDLQNDAQRELLHAGWEHVRRHLARHARQAGRAGELIGAPPPAQLARIVLGAMEGGCLAWCVHPTGSLIARLQKDLDALLSAWSVNKEVAQ